MMLLSFFFPLDTPVVTTILHVCQDFDRKLSIASTCTPTIFEREAVNIISIERILYSIFVEKFVLISQKKKLGRKIYDDIIFYNSIFTRA